MGIFGKKCLGVDIGASSVKIVEVSSFGKRKKIENYAKFSFLPRTSPVKTFQGEELVLLSKEASEILQAVLKKGGFRERRVAFSIPDFSTFFTTFTLPLMKREEVPKAVEFEARHHIPLPLTDVTFDWQIVEKKESFPGVRLKILLVAVPNRVLMDYQRLAGLAGVKLQGMEAEVFALIRSSIPKEKSQLPVCLVDIGWLSTTVSIIEHGNLVVSHSFDISSKGLTEVISSALKVDFNEAENLKVRFGLDPKKEKIIGALLPQANSLTIEIEKVCQDFYQAEGRKVTRLILAGGSSALFGLKEYLESRTKKKTQIINPFAGFSFPSVLQNRLERLGPSFAVATGAALMGLER